ncbi:hypothetical protein HU200_043083 [Digitaria exilis]|uniref:F-box domain-containing protein n=1 Tax=Digitaria exilis TaxID=1010633 RepID=A0A835B1J7_9POAL|nr:hypothetical protein HU200_043083 [Digitaria exilis]
MEGGSFDEVWEEPPEDDLDNPMEGGSFDEVWEEPPEDDLDNLLMVKVMNFNWRCSEVQLNKTRATARTAGRQFDGPCGLLGLFPLHSHSVSSSDSKRGGSGGAVETGARDEHRPVAGISSAMAHLLGASSLKKRRAGEEGEEIEAAAAMAAEEEDRISELPEDLRLRILTLLPLRSAIRTGALSTRWRALWERRWPAPSSMDLHIRPGDDPEELLRSLERRGERRIDRFSLTIHPNKRPLQHHRVRDPQRFLDYAAACAVEDLHIDAAGHFVSMLSTFIFPPGCSHLARVFIRHTGRVSFRSFPCSDASRFPALEVIHLYLVRSVDINELLWACPRLQTLDLRYCDVLGFQGVINLESSGAHLRSLTVAECNRITRLDASRATGLRSFCLSSAQLPTYNIPATASLDDLYLSLRGQNCEPIKHWIQALPNLANLTVLTICSVALRGSNLFTDPISQNKRGVSGGAVEAGAREEHHVLIEIREWRRDEKETRSWGAASSSAMAQLLGASTSKKQRADEEGEEIEAAAAAEEEDRISGLPEDLRLRILTLLPLKSAIRTVARALGAPLARTEVLRSLERRGLRRLDRFSLTIERSRNPADPPFRAPQRFIDYAAACGVEDLRVDVASHFVSWTWIRRFTLPPGCSHLARLFIRHEAGVSFGFSLRFDAFPALEVVHLHFVRIDINELLWACPRLKTLCLRRCNCQGAGAINLMPARAHLKTIESVTVLECSGITHIDARKAHGLRSFRFSSAGFPTYDIAGTAKLDDHISLRGQNRKPLGHWIRALPDLANLTVLTICSIGLRVCAL